MSDKKFTGIDGAVVSDAVSSDYEASLHFEKLRVGALGAYFRDGFKTRFLSYDRVERVFLRIQEVNGKLCCGSTTYAYFRLVFVVDGKEYVDYMSENEKAMRDALEAIRAAAPQVAIGYVKSEE